MAISLKFYDDSGLTTPHAGNLIVPLAVDGSDSPYEAVLYLGSTNSASTFQAASNPGVDSIVLSINDTTPGTVPETTNVRLATTQAGLDTATDGASLDLGTQILGGSANKVTVWIRVTWDVTQTTPGTNTQLSLTTNDIVEF